MNGPVQIETVTSVIASASEYIAQREAHEYADGDTPLAASLVHAGARVEAMTAVVTLAEALLRPGGLRDETLKHDLRRAICAAKGLTFAFDRVVRGAQQAAA